MKTDMDFSDALLALKKGERVSRKGWNGVGMWLILIKPGEHGEDSILTSHVDSEAYFNVYGDGELRVEQVIAMRTAKGTLQIGWLASQADMLANDWEVEA